MRDQDKLKILAIIPSGFCFGLQHVTVDFFSHFPASIERHFLLSKWSNGDLELLLKKNNINYSYSWLGMFSRKLDWENIKMSFYAFIRLPKLYFDFILVQKKLKPDILYFANHHELILLFPVLLFTKKKVVCHMHDPPPAIFFQKINFKWYSKKVNKFIAISENVRLRTIALGCSPDRITTIHNGIVIPEIVNNARLNKFTEQAAWPDNVCIIGITGQMNATKGHEDLLKAFRIVHAKNPLARLVIGGKPQEPLFGELIKLIAEWQIEKYVLFSGWLPEVSNFFQNIDVFVLASRHDEGYGLVVAEAMVHGLPVVITKSGGAVEIVSDSNGGFIVEKNDVEAMASKLAILSSNRQIYCEMAGNARNHIMQKFRLDIQTQVLVEEFQKIKSH